MLDFRLFERDASSVRQTPQPGGVRVQPDVPLLLGQGQWITKPKISQRDLISKEGHKGTISATKYLKSAFSL